MCIPLEAEPQHLFSGKTTLKNNFKAFVEYLPGIPGPRYKIWLFT